MIALSGAALVLAGALAVYREEFKSLFASCGGVAVS
jgi:hypothetical protein